VISRREVGEDESQIVAFSSVLLGIFCFAARARPLRFSLMATAILVVSWAVPLNRVETLYSERNFYGVVKVVDDLKAGIRYFYHGTTQHGAQLLDPAKRLKPIAYYGEGSPIAQLFRIPEIDRPEVRIASIGLGSGIISCLAKKGQRLTYFEINPAVRAVAENPDLFTFIRDCPARSDIVLGDGRLMPALQPAGIYSLIVLDAFSSNAIPVHLMTREALALYRTRLTETGIIVYHISNRYLDLSKVLAVLARNAGLEAYSQQYFLPDGEADGERPSHWVAMVKPEMREALLLTDKNWSRLEPEPAMPMWTDAYSNLFRVLK